MSGSSAASGDHHLQTLLSAFNADSNFISNESDVQTYLSSPPQIASVSSASLASGGECDCCGAALKVVGLDPATRARVRSALVELASETAYPTPPPPPLPPKRRQSSRLDYAFTGEGQGEMDRGGLGEAMGDLEQFVAWLEERRREVSWSARHYRATVCRERADMCRFVGYCFAPHPSVCFCGSPKV